MSASNSLVGANANDRVGSGGVGFLANGSYYVASNNFGANAGAVSIGAAVGGISGVVSGANSLVGQAAGDGYAVYQSLSESRLLVRASNADSNGLTNNGRLHIYAGGAGGGGGAGGALGAQGYGDNASVSVTITPAQITAITNSGTNVVLAASSDITLAAASDIVTNNSNGNGGELTLQAGRSIFINSSISTDNGNLNIYANDRVANGVQAANRDAGVAQITMAEGTLLNAGTGTVTLQLRDGAGHSGAMSAPDTTGLHTISMRSITAGSLSVRTDFGGIQIGSPDAVSASDITIAGDVHLAARTGILLAGGGSSGAFAQVSAGGTFKNDPLFPLVSAVPAPLELRNGGSFARIKSATPLLDLNCTTCLQESAFVVTGGFTDKAFTDLLLGQLLSPSGGGGGGVRLLKDPKDKEDDIALEADTCK